MEWWLVYLALGLVVGFLAGLLGIGGGMTMVPVLALLFQAQGFSGEHLMHLSLGTSLATIVFTSVSSMRAHHGHGAVLWPVVWRLTPGIALGTFCGALIAAALPTRPLALLFAVLVCGAATQMLLDRKPKPSRTLPGTAGIVAVGAGIGGISSVLAAGGAFMTVPFLTFCNVPLPRAIGTAAAVGFPVALVGTAGYILSGWGAPGLPGWSLGYIYLPALAWIVAATMAMAPLGARMAHRWPVKRLRRAFAVLLYILAGKMAWSLL